MITGFFYKFKRNNFRYNNVNPKIKALVIAIIIFEIVVLFMLFPHLHRKTYKVTVTNKQIITHNNTEEYLIYTQTEDGKIMVFKDTNSFLELKLNSKDLFMAVSINKKYEIKAYGFNIPILSDYQNIVYIKGI